MQSLSFYNELKDFFILRRQIAAKERWKMSRARKLSFRVGTTSYIYPDEILPNVRQLKGRVEDIELVLFETDNNGNIPAQKDLKELKSIGNDWDLTYTVHLPLNISFGSRQDDKRKKSIRAINSLIEHLSDLDAYAYILHLNLSRKEKRNIALWQDTVGESLRQISESNPSIVKKIAVENLSYPFEYLDVVIKDTDFSVCVDIGHLIVMGADVMKHLGKYFRKTRVIHFHGVNGRKDHVSLKYLDRMLIRRAIGFLKENDYRGVLTLEVFSQTDFEESMDILWANLYS